MCVCGLSINKYKYIFKYIYIYSLSNQAICTWAHKYNMCKLQIVITNLPKVLFPLKNKAYLRMLFFTCIKLVACVLASAHAIACIKWIRLVNLICFENFAGTILSLNLH